MQVINPITIAPFSPSSSSTLELARVSKREAGRAQREIDRGRASTEAARRGATSIAGEANGIRAKNNDVARGVAAANPGAESSLAFQASRNSGAVSGLIGQAERSSGDPRFNAPPPNYGAPEAQIGGAAGGIEGRGREVGRRSGEAQRLENAFREEAEI